MVEILYKVIADNKQLSALACVCANAHGFQSIMQPKYKAILGYNWVTRCDSDYFITQKTTMTLKSSNGDKIYEIEGVSLGLLNRKSLIFHKRRKKGLMPIIVHHLLGLCFLPTQNTIMVRTVILNHIQRCLFHFSLKANLNYFCI